MKRFLCLLFVLFLVSFPALADDDIDWCFLFYYYACYEPEAAYEYAENSHIPLGNSFFTESEEWIFRLGLSYGYADGYAKGEEDTYNQYCDDYDNGFSAGYDECLSDHEYFE